MIDLRMPKLEGVGAIAQIRQEFPDARLLILTTITLMEYGDYQCLECGQAHRTIKTIQQQLGEQMCFIFDLWNPY